MGFFRRFTALLIPMFMLALPAHADDIARKVRIADADYTVALESLEIAIGNQGLAIAARHEAAKTIERTAADLGHRPDVLKNGEIVAFCSVRLGAMMLEEDPHNVVNCPMTVAIYQIPSDPTAVYLAWRELSGDSPGTKALNAMLKAIIDETAENSGL